VVCPGRRRPEAAERYYVRWYGPGAATREHEPAVASDAPARDEEDPEAASLEQLRAAFLDLDEAARSVEGRPGYRERVDHMRMYLHYLCLRQRLRQADARNDRESILAAIQAETVFGGRLNDTNMTHARPLIGKAFLRRFRKYEALLATLPEENREAKLWRRLGTPPTHEELNRLWHQDLQLTWEIVEKVIAAERPDALLPTLGGQTGLNLAMDLSRHGVLEKYGVEMIGANAEVIAKAEERDRFKAAMERIGLEVCRGETVGSLEEAREVIKDIGLPCVVRPSFTLGGTGSSVAYNRDEFDRLVAHGLDESPIHEVLLEESVLGWKEFEMEVMRDKDDNVVIICSIENFDPMGVHTGDSITVAPAQTLTDKEYQRMRDASLAVIRKIGVETGGSNIQFAIHPTPSPAP